MPTSTNRSECHYNHPGVVPRLYFGVPLEDVFSENDIHPTIKKLFLQAYEKSTACEAYSVEEILGRFQGSLEERLALKESVASHRLSKEDFPAGAFIWVIRHFVGLLPIPLLPRYTNEKFYEWGDLSGRCRLLLKKSKDARKDQEETKRITNAFLASLSNLSRQCFLTFCLLMSFLRGLSVHPRGEPFFDRSAAIFLTKYFVNAIFVRPYRPGHSTEKEKRLAPLLFFLLANWPRIVSTMTKGTFEFSGSPCLCKLIQNLNAHYSHAIAVETSTQTDSTTPDCIKEEVEYYSCQMDSYCQTETLISSEEKRSSSRNSWEKIRSGCCCSYGSHYELVKEESLKISRKNVCCCRYSSHYESFIKVEHEEEEEEDPKTKTTRSALSDTKTLTLFENGRDEKPISSTDNSNNSRTEGALYPNLVPFKAEGRRLSSYVHSASFNNKNDEYIYDDYFDQYDFIGSGLNLVLKKDEDLYSENAPSSPEEELTLRISKIGWSYTNNSNNEINASANDSLSPLPPSIGWNMPKANYSIYFDTTENLANDAEEDDNDDNDEKDKCEVSSLENIISTTEKDTGDSTDASNSKGKSNMEKLKSKLSFNKHRLFEPRRMKLKRTASFDNIDSNVKYEKMNPARSNIF